MLDPYATRAIPIMLADNYWNTAPHLPPYIDMKRPVIMGHLSALTDRFDWKAAARPIRPEPTEPGATQRLEDTVMCELDVQAFTQVKGGAANDIPDCRNKIPK